MAGETTMNMPLVSVLLPVFNGGKYVREAVDSILQQTYGNLELIIINDGSTDDTAAIVASYSDRRVRYFEQENIGLAATLNRAVLLSEGRYLARQDSDDVSLPTRLEKQVAFLESHPACGMVGTWAEIWKEGEKTERSHLHPSDNAVLSFDLLFNNPFVHSSVMIRGEVFTEVGLYCTDRSRQPPEDYELWSRIARKYEVANIPEILHVYRETSGSICRENWVKLMEMVVKLSAENVAYASGRSCRDRHVVNLSALANGVHDLVSGLPDLKEMKTIFDLAAGRFIGADDVERRMVRDSKWRYVRYSYYRYLVETGLRTPLLILRKLFRMHPVP